MRGSDVLLEVLATEGVTYVFGNPGTTELPFLDALAEEGSPEYVLALHEGTVVAMADGYAQVTRRPSFVNLHTAAGLGNAMGILANVRATRTPMVVTAGQQHQGHLAAEPFLSGDLVETAAPLSKWAREVRRPDDLGILLRRAFRDAMHQPPGPVFLSIPMDVLDGETARPVPAATPVDDRVVPADLGPLAGRIAAVEPGRFAVVAGDEVAHSGAVSALVAVAEALGCPVFGTPLHSNLVFPTTHPLWAGALRPDAVAIAEVLARFDVILLIGDRGFMAFEYRETDPVPKGTTLLHLSANPSDLGRTYPAELAIVGDPKSTLALLAERLVDRPEALEEARARIDAGRAARQHEREAAARRAEAALDELAPMDPEVIVYAVLSAAPLETRVVDEGPTTDPLVRRFLQASEPDRFFYSRGGALGWGMGAALGVSLAAGREPVLCVVGDGSTLYAPQALWTAARLRLPVTFAVMNNGSYLILKRFLNERGGPAARRDRFLGMDLGHPEVDFVALAESFGVRACRPASPGEAADAVSKGLSSGEPSLLDLHIKGSLSAPIE